MASTILVIGATGTTGRRLVPLLTAGGTKVRAASRGGPVPFDWTRRETHAAAVAAVDAIYMIPPPLVADPAPIVAPLLADAKAAGVGRIVLVSSLGVTFPGEPARSGRRELEQLVRESGLAWTILRPGGFAQNFSEGFLGPGVAAGQVASATGDGRAAFVDADDIARVAAAALVEPHHAGATYELTGPEALTFAEALATIARFTGRTIVHRAISPGDLTGMLVGFGLPADYAAIVVRDQQAIRDGHAAVVSDDIARVTGTPAVTFAEFVARTTWATSPA